MQAPIEISFHGLDHSAVVEGKIRERLAKLDQRYGRITGGRVVVEAQHQSRSHLNATSNRPFHVSIHLIVPGGELNANREGKKAEAHANIDSAISDSFKTVERQLKDYRERRKEHYAERRADRSIGDDVAGDASGDQP